MQIKDGPDGAYHASFEHKGVSKESTFFPKDYTPEKVIAKIYEALENVNFTKYPTRGDQKVRGLTKDGITIEMIVNLTSCKVKSAYPVWDEIKHGQLLKRSS